MVVSKVCDALVYLLDNIFIRFGTKLYRQTIGIPMGTNCAPLVADLFLFFCYERDFMKSLSRENQADIIEAFNSKKVRKKKKVQGVPQSQTAALPRPQEEEETDKSKQAQTEQTYVRKALRLALSSPSEVIATLKGLKNTRTK